MMLVISVLMGSRVATCLTESFVKLAKIRWISSFEAVRDRPYLTPTGWRRVTCCLAFGILFMWPATHGLADDCTTQTAQPEVAQKTSHGTLHYTVTPETSEIELGGKLWVIAELRNSGREPVTVFWGDYAYPKMYHFDITHESGCRLPTTRGFPNDWLPRSAEARYMVTIEPGTSLKYEIALARFIGRNGQETYFRRPGKYRVEPSLFVATTEILDFETGETRPTGLGSWTGRLEAEPFTISVMGEADVVNEGVRLYGQIVNHLGAPVPNALIFASIRVTPGPFDQRVFEYLAKIDQAISDEMGRFEFVRLPASSRFFELTTITNDFPITQSKIENNPPEPERQLLQTKVELPEGITLKGRVVDAQGKPWDDVRFEAGPHRYGFSDIDGQFALRGMKIADAYKVRLWRRGFSEAIVQVSREVATSGTWTVILQRAVEE